MTGLQALRDPLGQVLKFAPPVLVLCHVLVATIRARKLNSVV